MKALGAWIILLFIYSLIVATPGDTISYFTLPGVPAPYNYSGVEKDPFDGNIWASVDSGGRWQYCKFDISTHNITIPWQTLADQYRYTHDIGYPYLLNGVNNLVFTTEGPDFNSVYILVNPQNNQITGYLPGSFAYSTSNRGCAVSHPDDRIYVSNYASSLLLRSDYPFTAWSTFTSGLNCTTGLAAGWGHLFVTNWVATPPFQKIYQIRLSDGFTEKTIELTNWNLQNRAMGLACGRVNAVGDNESLFISAMSYSPVGGAGIYEVEIDDVWPNTTVQPLSLGEIKAGYR